MYSALPGLARFFLLKPPIPPQTQQTVGDSQQTICPISSLCMISYYTHIFPKHKSPRLHNHERGDFGLHSYKDFSAILFERIDVIKHIQVLTKELSKTAELSVRLDIDVIRQRSAD